MGDLRLPPVGHEPRTIYTCVGGACCQEVAVHDDLLTDEAKPAERGAQGREIGPRFLEPKVARSSGIGCTLIPSCSEELADPTSGSRWSTPRRYLQVPKDSSGHARSSHRPTKVTSQMRSDDRQRLPERHAWSTTSLNAHVRSRLVRNRFRTPDAYDHLTPDDLCRCHPSAPRFKWYALKALVNSKGCPRSPGP